MFEDEVSYIWRNAKEYNEDGSDMYILATEFEVCPLHLLRSDGLVTDPREGAFQVAPRGGEGKGRRAFWTTLEDRWTETQGYSKSIAATRFASTRCNGRQ